MGRTEDDATDARLLQEGRLEEVLARHLPALLARAHARMAGCGGVDFTPGQAAINRRIAIASVVRVNRLLVRTVDVAGSGRASVLLTTSDETTRRRLEARTIGAGGLGAPTRVSAAADGDPIFPWVGADAAGGFHAVWVTGRRDLAYSRSADGGTWSAPRQLAYAPEGSGIFNPVAATGPSGGWAAWDQNASSGSVYAAPVPPS